MMVLRPIIAGLRLILIHAYMENLEVLVHSPNETVQALALTILTLISSGFLRNVKKSDLNPTQDLVNMGF